MLLTLLDHFEEGETLRGRQTPSDETMVQKWRGPTKESFSFNT